MPSDTPAVYGPQMAAPAPDNKTDPTVWERVNRTANGALIVFHSSANMLEQANNARDLLYDVTAGMSGRRARLGAAIAVFVLGAATLRKVLGVSKVAVAGSDAPAIENLDKWVGTTISCGMAAGMWVATVWTGGAVGVLTVTQTISCAKSGFELYDTYKHPKKADRFFESTVGRSVSLTVDGIGVLGSVLGLGAAAVKVGTQAATVSVNAAMAAALGRTVLLAPKAELVMTAMDMASLGLSGVDLIVHVYEDGSTCEETATPTAVRQALNVAGIRTPAISDAERIFSPPSLWDAQGPRALFEWMTSRDAPPTSAGIGPASRAFRP